tara:strand:+ start:79 stop:348 length:270 start_codon:yes stop_codon:yes gene_type:complete
MKVELKKTDKIVMNYKPNKRLNITIFYSDRFKLMNLLHTIVKSIHYGTTYKREEVESDFYEFELKYSERYDYQERIIDGQVCHVYTSRI